MSAPFSSGALTRKVPTKVATPQAIAITSNGHINDSFAESSSSASKLFMVCSKVFAMSHPSPALRP